MATLLEIRAAYPHLFAQQTWYEEEPFARRPLESALAILPTGVEPCRNIPYVWLCHSAVALADLFVRMPAAPVWDGFLWSSDLDRWGQRVFVGGRTMQRGFAGVGLFQVHRFVDLTDEWGIPVWQAV